MTRKLLTAVFAAGAVPAGPGEFTKRAFINGKLTLSEAEAVAGIIDASSEKHLGVSLLQLEGSLSRKIGDIYSRLAFLASSVYAFIIIRRGFDPIYRVDEMKKYAFRHIKRLARFMKAVNTGKRITRAFTA